MERLSDRWMFYCGLLAGMGVGVDDLKHIQDLIDAEEQGLLLRLEHKNGWIPCSERLPKENEIVMCSIKREYASYRIVINRFTNEDYWHNGIVEAWQPLPKPYEEAEQKLAEMKGE